MKNHIKLFTPGPLSMSPSVRASMNIDIGTRTETIVDLTRDIRTSLENIADCGPKYTSILLQGSGTFAVEAMISSFIGLDDWVLVISNGVYANRISTICKIYNLNFLILESADTAPIDLEKVQKFLEENKKITVILAVQLETTLGVLNDINGLTALASSYSCKVFIDAMSAFGVLKLNYVDSLIAVAASANKCLHGAPGVGFVIVNKRELLKKSSPRTLSLDLKAQWQEFENSGQWRFTPPTHVLLALKTAIHEFENSGGSEARLAKYQIFSDFLVKELAAIDIHPVINDNYRTSIVITFILGKTHLITSDILYKELFFQGLVVYPSNFYPGRSFRIACIGHLNMNDMNKLIETIKTITDDRRIK